ncbi:discoidin domain-containing protein [Collinsella sp. zg1085]|uniref:discoidin domain-containing protein n=1 Tax=Collinsella sp. zg1085 TaxID=2844380 RepID=UPI001C0BD5FE|nr:discoidin domain-containing protein [Collinsella sp. zg1085]QWT17581.1 discoidin domain-containing protein [Collinsella sp. zg1085]
MTHGSFKAFRNTISRSAHVFAVALSLGLGLFGTNTAFATTDHGGGAVEIAATEQTVTIGNEYLSRTYSKADGSWKTTEIVNKRINKTLVPQPGSQDFVLGFDKTGLEGGTEQSNPTQKIDRTGWQASLTTSGGTAFPAAEVAKLFDDNPDTHIDDWQKNGYPISLVIDMGSVKSVGAFSYLKRPGYDFEQYGTNGTMGAYKLYVSDDGSAWRAAGSGEFTRADHNLHKVGDKFNVGDVVYGKFDQVYQTRYVKIEQLSDALGSTQEFTGSEINLFADQGTQAMPPNSQIKASDLHLERVTIDEDDNSIRAEFRPIEFAGVTYTLAHVTTMEDGAHYMNTHLEVTASDPSARAIDFIDLDRFELPTDAEGVWSIPDLSEVSSMWIGKHELMLGQPIYANGMFFGSEFPAADSDIKGNAMQMRYYSGKTIAKMAEDKQDVGADGRTFYTWKNVVGAAQGIDTSVVQTDFFSYINDIATPSKFRMQYNSWYDNMMDIDDASVARSFLGTEKGLAENGVKPLDSYVVDDGWNNYYNELNNVAPSSSAGTTHNKTGFWEFNAKFPNELYTSTSLAHKLQSSFGMWVGPQGGYNYFSGFADFLASKGTAHVTNAQWKAIDTGSRTYIKNFEKRFIDYQKRFDIDYWKWDGFALRPSTEPNNNHMVGGDNNMYFTSDMWEAWTDLMENFRSARAAEGKDLWINATCYINPSPWMLQWVNSIWVQDSGDTGQAANAGAARHQQKIYYRDHVYYNLYKRNQIQFPLKNIYNHDPIYGVSDNSQATTDVFREFLMDNAMRGTAFWELYFSPSIMDEEKFMVTADVLAWAEQNFDVLQHAKLFAADNAFAGNITDAVNGVYGFSAWTANKGIVSFVNPTATEQTYQFSLSDAMGVPRSVRNLAATQVFPYTTDAAGQAVSYGDTISVTLPAHSSKIFQYGETDTTKPEIQSVKQVSDTAVRVRFNTRMNDSVSFTVDGQAVAARLLADYRTFELTVDANKVGKQLSATHIKTAWGVAGDDATLEVATAKDISTVTSAADIQGTPFSEFAVTGTEAKMLRAEKKSVAIAEKGIVGTGDFSVRAAIATSSKSATILEQGDDWSLAIDENGYIVFTVKGESVSSKHDETRVTALATGTFGTDEHVPTQTETTTLGVVADNKLHTVQAVREMNGMLKLYVDGELVNSAYRDGTRANLAGKPVTLGSEGLAGYVGGVHVSNSARYYDDAANQAHELNIGVAERALPTDGWTATASSEQTSTAGTGGDGAAADTVDGNDATYWHSAYSGPHAQTSGVHWLKLDFGKETSFDNLVYTARSGLGNGTWQTVKIVGIAADGSETVIKDTADVTLEGREARFAFDSTQNFRAVRFEVTGKGGHASGAEIAATRNVAPTHPLESVAELMTSTRELAVGVEASAYTSDSYETFANVVHAIEALNPFNPAHEAEVAGLRAQLTRAHASLVAAPKPVVKHTVSFIADNVVVVTQEIADGEQATPVDAPAKDGWTFQYWGRAVESTPALRSMRRADTTTPVADAFVRYDFATPVHGNLRLTAVYTENEQPQPLQPGEAGNTGTGESAGENETPPTTGGSTGAGEGTNENENNPTAPGGNTGTGEGAGAQPDPHTGNADNGSGSTDAPSAGDNTGTGSSAGTENNSGGVADAGNTGNTGNTGDTGNSSNAGNTGNIGNAGNAGTAGNTGNIGSTGNTEHISSNPGTENGSGGAAHTENAGGVTTTKPAESKPGAEHTNPSKSQDEQPSKKQNQKDNNNKQHKDDKKGSKKQLPGTGDATLALIGASLAGAIAILSVAVALRRGVARH